MIGSLRNFSKSKFAGLLVFIMIIPFVFWGMGSMFSTGNTNTIAKINKKNISTQEFIDYLNKSGVPQKYIRENLDKNIIQELLAGLISSTLLDLEIENFDIIISENTLLKEIKNNKNFQDENGNFERIRYEKFLLENNQTAPGFELRLKQRQLQKLLFDYIGAGTVTPNFLAEGLFEEENKTLDIDFLNLDIFYEKKSNITNNEISKFISENNDNLKIEYLDFRYIVLNPLNLIGIDDFNQAFFDKIDQIEIDISNEITFETISTNLNIIPTKVSNFRFSPEKKDLEKKIYESRNNKIDILEIKNDYVLYKIDNIEKKVPDINDDKAKKEIIDLILQKKKFEFNKELLEKIDKKLFTKSEFFKMGNNSIKSIKLNSIKDNKKFEINAIELLYSLPVGSFTLINDDKDNNYLAMIKNFENKTLDNSSNDFKKYLDKYNSNNKKTILKSYDLLLSDKYDITLNQKTIERVKNFFQ